jgi:hypothetical protein
LTFPTTSNGVGGTGKNLCSTTLGASECGHITYIPPPTSKLGQWLETGDNSDIMTMVCPAGSLIDITYDLVISWTNFTISPYSFSATAGAQYIVTLRDTSGTSQLLPVGNVITA